MAALDWDNPLYQKVNQASKQYEVHAIYPPEESDVPGQYMAAVDLFGRTFKVFFTEEEDGYIWVTDIERWRFG